MTRRSRTMLRAAVLATAIVPRSLFAYHANYYFVGPSGSLYSDPANWSTTPGGPGGTPPGNGDLAYVSPTGALTLTLDASPVDTSANGDATLRYASFAGASAAAPLTVDVTLVDSDVDYDTAKSLYLNSFWVGPNVTVNHPIGRITATLGSVSVSGPNTTYSLSGSAYLSGSAGVLFDGATVSQSGGVVLSDNAVRISASSYSLSGGVIGGDDVLVDSSPPNTVTQSGGSVGGYYSTVIGRNTCYTLSAGSLSSSTLIQVGGKSSIDASTFPDVGTTLAQTGGTVQVNGAYGGGNAAVVVNASPGATALYAMSGGTLSVSGGGGPSGLYVGKTTSGSLAQTGGSAGATDISVADQPGSAGTYSLSGDAQTSASHMEVGKGGSGSLTVADSAAIALTYGLTVAAGPNSTGTVTQTGGVIRPTAFAGGVVSPCTLTLAAGAGSSASYSLSGGSVATQSTTVGAAGHAYFGQAGGAHTTGTLTIANSSTYDLVGGSLAAASVTNSGTFYMQPGASFTLTGTTFTNNGSATFDGAQSWPAGSTFANTLVAYFHSDPGSAANATLNVTSASPDWAPVVFDAPAVHLASLALSGTTRATVPAGAGRLLSTRSLSITGTARLDLADNTLVVDYAAAGAASAADAVRQDLLAGGLASSSAGAGHRLGYSDSGAAVTVRLALAGDANLDGRLDADDYALLDRSFAKSLTNAHWIDGDFDYDGVVDASDYLLIDTTFGQAQGFSPGFLSMRESQFGDAYVSRLLATVPEPSALACLFASLPFCTRRRRRE